MVRKNIGAKTPVLFQKLLSVMKKKGKETRWEPPRNFWVEITNCCNFNCSFCPYGIMKRKKEYMDFKTFRKIIDMLADDGLVNNSHVGLHLMGEPFLHPELIRFIEYMNSRGVLPDLYTNGTFLNPEKINELSALTVVRLVISIQSPDEASFKQARFQSGMDWKSYIERIESAIGRYLERLDSGEPTGLRQIDVLYMTSFGFMPNMKGLQSWMDVLKILKNWTKVLEEKSGLPVQFPQPVKEADDIYKFQLMNNKDHILNIAVREAGAWTGSLYGEENYSYTEKGSCANPFNQLIVLVNGDVTLCCEDYDGEMVIGNIHETRLKRLWQGKDATEIREGMQKNYLTSPLCRRCLGSKPEKETKPEAEEGEFYAVETWSEDNRKFQWMGKSAAKIVALDRNSSHLEFSVITIIQCSENDPQHVRISLNGKTVKELALKEHNVWVPCKIFIPDDLRGRWVVLKCETDRAIRPSDAFGSVDVRLLGAGFSFTNL